MENKLQTIEQKLLIENNKKISLTCVDSVDGFTDELLKLTVQGNKVIIKGNNIKITQFNKTNGNFMADGTFYQILMAGENSHFVKKLFK